MSKDTTAETQLRKLLCDEVRCKADAYRNRVESYKEYASPTPEEQALFDNAYSAIDAFEFGLIDRIHEAGPKELLRMDEAIIPSEEDKPEGAIECLEATYGD